MTSFDSAFTTWFGKCGLAVGSGGDSSRRERQDRRLSSSHKVPVLCGGRAAWGRGSPVSTVALSGPLWTQQKPTEETFTPRVPVGACGSVMRPQVSRDRSSGALARLHTSSALFMQVWDVLSSWKRHQKAPEQQEDASDSTCTGWSPGTSAPGSGQVTWQGHRPRARRPHPIQEAHGCDPVVSICLCKQARKKAPLPAPHTFRCPGRNLTSAGRKERRGKERHLGAHPAPKPWSEQEGTTQSFLLGIPRWPHFFWAGPP